MAGPDDEIDPGADIDAGLDADYGGGADTSALPTVVRQQRRQPISAGQPVEGAQLQFIDGSEATPPKQQGTLRDLADQFMASSAEAGQSLISFASLATRNLTENPAVVGWLEQQQKWLGSQAESWVSSMSPEGQKAAHATLFGGDTDANGNHIPSPGEVGWPRFIAHSIVGMVPGPVVALLGGGLTAAAVATLPATVAAGAGVAGAATTAGIFGFLQAGGWYHGFVDTIDKATPEQLMGSPAYAEARQQGMSDADSRRNLVKYMMPFAGAQFAVGAAAGAGAGQLLKSGAMGAAGAGLTRRMAIGGVEGSGLMGGQAGAGDALSQQANINAGVQSDFDHSQTAKAFASGAIGGAALGALGGALHRSLVRPPVETTEVPADHQAALVEALGLPAPPERLAITYQPDRTRGDGFTMPSEHTPAVPTQPQLSAPPERLAITYNPDRPRGDGFVVSTPEPARDMAAQVQAMTDPSSPRDAVFIAKGTAMPTVPAGVMVVPRASGTLLTTNQEKATLFRRGTVDDAKLASILGFPETKEAAIASGNPQVVQGVTAEGAVAHESLASQGGVQLAATQAAANVPGGAVRVVTPEAAQARRSADISTHPVDMVATKAAEPTPAQAEAGNYQKGHLALHGLDISIETPKGAVRRGPIDEKTGAPVWQNEMPAHYGYIRGTRGGDGEHVDTNLGPRTKAIFDGKPADAAREPVFIVDQRDPKTGKFDEHKAFIGFHTAVEATHAYDSSFSDGSGPARRGAVNEMTFDGFKTWLKGDTTKAISYKNQNRGEQLRAQQKARMAEPVATLVKRSEAKRLPEIKPEEDDRPMSVGAREESEGQAQVFESEGKAATTVVEETPAEKPRSPLTTNKDRVLSDLESKVSNGLMSAAEADREYGRKAEGVGGRERKYPDFSSWLRERITQAEDPKVQQDIIDRATRLQNDKTLTGAKRNAAVRSINSEIDRTGSEYAGKLREMLREVEDPVAVAAEKAERKASALAGVRGLKDRLRKKDDVAGAARNDAMSTLYRDERINRPVWDMLDESKPIPGVEGQVTRSRPVHEYLDRIANDPVIRTRLPQVVALARRLRKLLPADLEVYSKDYAEQIFRESERFPEWMAGAFDPRHDIIVLNPRARQDASAVEVLLHESMHAVTTRYLREHPGRTDAVLQVIRDELTSSKARDLNDATTFDYAISNNEELHTMLMTNPVMQRIASEITPSPEFRARMRELGYGPQESKSLWSAFTGWVKRIFGKPDVSDSLLDHVLRPLEDIVDRADKFNHGKLNFIDESLPPELRPAARDTLDAALSAMPRFTRDGAAETGHTLMANLREMGDRARRLVLTGATSDQIINFNRDLFKSRDPLAPGNTLEKWRTAAEAEAHRAHEFRNEYGDQVHKILNQLKGPDKEKIASLMNDATIADVRLGSTSADANAHLIRPEQQEALRQMQARYNALSPEGKSAYNAARDYYRETYNIERGAQLSAMIKAALPDATPQQIEALTQATRTRRGINQLIDNPDASPAAAAFADAWSTNRALVRGIAKVHSQGFVRGDYFPLRRYGDYVVNYGTKGADDYGVEMFERRGQAEVRRAELLRQGAEPSQVLDKRKSNLRTMIPTTVMDELDTAMRHMSGFTEEHANSVRDLFALIQLQHASRSEAARTRLRRQGVKGASTDVTRVLAQDFLALSSRLGYLEHGPERMQAIAEMRRHSDWLGRNGEAGEQIRAQAVVGEVELRQPSGDDASGMLTGLTRKFSTFGFVYSLMSPSHTLMNAVDVHLVSSALLGARHGYARSGLALAKALKDVSPTMIASGARNTIKAVGEGLKASDWNLSYAARDRLIAAGADRASMTDLFNRLNNAGLIDHSMAREMHRIANPTAEVAMKWWDRFMDLNAAMGHAVDVANKSAIAKAAYDLELRRTSSHDLAAKYAVNQVRDSTPNNNLTNKARIATSRGPLGAAAAPLLQFKQFGIHMYSVMANLGRASIHGASRQERVEARKALAGILATHSLMAGSLTLIADPLRYIGGAYDFITGADKPHDYQNDVRSWIADAFGPEIGEIVSRGLPHLAGVDIHNRVGINNMLNMPDLKEFTAKGMAETIAAAMTGAAGQDATKMAEGMHKILKGDVVAGIKDLAPRIIRDPMKAGIVPGMSGLADKGVTDSKGRTIMPASKLSNLDIAYQAIGFQPSRVSEFREQRNADIEFRDEVQSARSHAFNKFLTSTPAERRDALVEVQAYNRRHPESPITYAQLTAGIKRQQEAVQSRSGLKLSKNMQAALNRQGAFANVQ